MRRLAKCSRCGELYRAVLDGHDPGVCPLCIEVDQAAHSERELAKARRRDLFLGIGAGLMLAGGLAGFFFSRGPEAAVARTGGPRMEVRTDPVAVDVFLDEQWVGTSSLDGHLTVELPRGEPDKHWLEFRRDGFQSQRRLLAMADLTRPMGVLMARAPLDARIDSEPTGAAVWIAGEPRGLTPLAMNLPVESLSAIPLRVVKDGYEPLERNLPMPAPGQPLRFSAKLEAAAPRVQVDSSPAGAAVWLDGREVGKAPTFVALDRAARGRRITLHGQLVGYSPAAADVEIPERPDATPRVTLHFDAPATALRIETQPPGGTVWLNGRRIGTSPQRVELADDELARPLHVEASLGRTHFGERTVAAPTQGREEPVTVQLAFVGRKVVLAVALTPSTSLTAIRERLKDEVQRLDPNQQFCMVAAADDARQRAGSTIARSWDDWLPASSENKVRAYDFIDQLRPSSGGDVAAELPRVVAGMAADVAWFYIEQPPARDAWQRWFGQKGPSLCIVGGPGMHATDGLASWLAAHRGTLEALPETASAQGPAAEPEDAP